MDRKQVQELIQKYNRGLASTKEKAWLDNWYMEKLERLLPEEETIDFDGIDADLRRRTFRHAGIAERNFPHQTQRLKLWPAIVAVAAVVIVVASILFYPTNDTPVVKYKVSKNDVAPGTNKAVLTLANGKQIVLNEAGNGALASEADAIISKTSEGQLVYERADKDQPVSLYNNITTPRGGQYSLRLADGTRVILNAASSLRYPTVFKGTDRTVELTGEGYFEVAHNSAKPFRVISKGQQVQVLGTHFNINAYADEPTVKTTLLEGSVNVNGILIKPNQQAVLMNGDQIIVKQVNANDVVAWKDGLFKFDHTDIKTSMRQIARWYDVEVVYEGDIGNEQFYGKIERSYTLSEVLKVLELSKVHFKIEGKKIIVSP